MREYDEMNSIVFLVFGRYLFYVIYMYFNVLIFEFGKRLKKYYL